MKTFLAMSTILAGLLVLPVCVRTGGGRPVRRVSDRLRRHQDLSKGRRPPRAETAGREAGPVGTLGTRWREQRFRDRRGDEAG